MTIIGLLVLDGILVTLLLILVFLLDSQMKKYDCLKRNYSTITVLQKIMEVFGSKSTSQEKLVKINDIFLKDFNIMFSTIVSYSENEKKHSMKVSNVEKEYYSDLEKLNESSMFNASCDKNIPKYITSSVPQNLGYPGSTQRGIKSALFMPLFLQDTYAGFWILEDTRPNAFDRLDKIQLSIIKNNMSLILENSIYAAAIEKMAIRDKLTGMYNRNYLYARAVEKINKFNSSVVVICDIDLFKKVNDSYGHDVGDQVLVNVSRIINKNLTENDILIRFGGEEFVVILMGQDIISGRQKIEGIRTEIEKSSVEIMPDKIVKVTVSFGMGMYKQGEDIDKAIKSADLALYRAKENGRNRVEVAEGV